MPTHRKRPCDPAQCAKFVVDIVKVLEDWEAAN